MGVSKEVIQFNLDGEEIRKFKSLNEVSVFLGVDKSFISRHLKSGKEYNGYIFKYSGNDNRIDYNHSDLEFKCPYCEKHFGTYNGLCKHIFKENAHGDITKEQLLTDYKYGGIRPTCKCGCGEYTNISYDGGAHFLNYVSGHHNRVNNNWGHNKNAQIKSAETRRKQYANGERIQWNKGKSWDETYTKKEQERLLESLQSQERRKKIRLKLTGKEKSPEQKAFIKKMGQEQWFKDLQREKMVKRLKEGAFSVSSQIELEFIDKCIKPLGVEYIKQYYIKELTHFCDIYFPKKNIIVEFNGDFWHCNPSKYPNGPIHHIQETKIMKDANLRTYCDMHDILLIEIWESEYKENCEKIKQILKEAIL